MSVSEVSKLVSEYNSLVEKLLKSAAESTQSGSKAGIDRRQSACVKLGHVLARMNHVRRLLVLNYWCQINRPELVEFVYLCLKGAMVMLHDEIHFSFSKMKGPFSLSSEFLQLSQSGRECLEELQDLNADDLEMLGEMVIDNPDLLELVSNDDVLQQALLSADKLGAKLLPKAKAAELHLKSGGIDPRILQQLSDYSIFGVSIAEEDGGVGAGYQATVGTTMALCRHSMSALGSPSTRPEIFAGALRFGTQAQRDFWLPKLADGSIRPCIAVTEPNVGSDVSSVECSGKVTDTGVVVSGKKYWCTWAAQTQVMLTLVCTNPDAKPGKGLSLLMIEKEAFELDEDGCPPKEFHYDCPEGGKIHGHRIETPAYHGMGEYEIDFEDVFVPLSHVVGGRGGLNNGMKIQMAAFAPGRLQTAGRALGNMRAAIESAIEYSKERVQFGKAISEFGNTKDQIAESVIRYVGSLYFAFDVARKMDRVNPEDETALRGIQTLGSLLKFQACEDAERTARAAQLICGSASQFMGSPIPMLRADADLLSIFEGNKIILVLRVVLPWFLPKLDEEEAVA